MSSDLQPVYTASAELTPNSSGYGLYFGKSDSRNKSGSVEGDVFEAELVAINELLLIALDEGAYGYKVFTSNSKILAHINRGENQGDPAVLSEIHSNLSKLLHNKVDVDFELADSKPDRDLLAEAVELAAN